MQKPSLAARQAQHFARLAEFSDGSVRLIYRELADWWASIDAGRLDNHAKSEPERVGAGGKPTNPA